MSKILLIVAGGIAAYKSLELVRLARKDGLDVTAVLTKSGAEFITPLSLQALTENPVHQDMFSLTDEQSMGHIALSRAADLVVVAPATANLLARMACGLAGDLASTLLLATDKRVLVAPSMNMRMWLHPATQENVAKLRARGVLFVGPDDGDMACHEFGPGRLAEPEVILLAIQTALSSAAPGKTLAGKHAIVTSGPTQEPIDHVRFIANRSSGKQGHAIAEALAAAGARVTLVTGPVSLPDPVGCDVVEVETAREMQAAVMAALPADIAVCAAAVGDWRVETVHEGKIKKSPGAAPPLLHLVENPDILAGLARAGGVRPRLLIGFAAETQNLRDTAVQKRVRKGCDWLVANHVGVGSDVMGGENNQVHLITAHGVEDWPLLAKTAVAEKLVSRIAAHFAGELS